MSARRLVLYGLLFAFSFENRYTDNKQIREKIMPNRFYSTVVKPAVPWLLTLALLLSAGCRAALPRADGADPSPQTQTATLGPQPEETSAPDEAAPSPAPYLSRFQPAYATGTETYPIAEGLREENLVTVLQGAEPGPAVYIVGGIHGDETAGIMAADVAKQISIRKGTLYILSPANAYGAAHEKRTTRADQDVNRSFPGDVTGSDAQIVAASIYADIEEKRPALVLDLHEARGPRPGWDDLSYTLIVEDVSLAGDLIWDLTLSSERGELGEPPFTLMGSPPQGSLNRTVSRELGIPVITVETWRGDPLETRIQRQLSLIAFVLEYLGMR